MEASMFDASVLSGPSAGRSVFGSGESKMAGISGPEGRGNGHSRKISLERR